MLYCQVKLVKFLSLCYRFLCLRWIKTVICYRPYIASSEYRNSFTVACLVAFLAWCPVCVGPVSPFLAASVLPMNFLAVMIDLCHRLIPRCDVMGKSKWVILPSTITACHYVVIWTTCRTWSTHYTWLWNLYNLWATFDEGSNWIEW